MSANITLLLIALALNVRDIKMLALILVVAAGIFVPIGHVDHEWEWFLRCFVVEIIVATISYILNCRATNTIIALSGFLMIAHVVGGIIYCSSLPIEYSYPVIVPTLETLEIVALSIFSQTFIKKAVRLWTWQH